MITTGGTHKPNNLTTTLQTAVMPVIKPPKLATVKCKQSTGWSILCLCVSQTVCVRRGGECVAKEKEPMQSVLGQLSQL